MVGVDHLTAYRYREGALRLGRFLMLLTSSRRGPAQPSQIVLYSAFGALALKGPGWKWCVGTRTLFGMDPIPHVHVTNGREFHAWAGPLFLQIYVSRLAEAMFGRDYVPRWSHDSLIQRLRVA